MQNIEDQPEEEYYFPYNLENNNDIENLND